MRKIILAGVFLASVFVRASEPELYTLTTRSEMIPDRGPVTRTEWKIDNGVLSLIRPPDWDLSSNSREKKLLLRSVSLMSGISMRVVTNFQNGARGSDISENLKNRVRKEFPEARIREEFTAHTSAGPGPVVEIEIDNAGLRTCHRLAWIPFEGGLIEFDLISPERSLSLCHGAWTTVMNSLRIDPVSLRR